MNPWAMPELSTKRPQIFPCGKIKRVELKNVNGALIWSVDVMQSGKKDFTDVWVDARTGKITALNIETPTFERTEVAEEKVKKWLSRPAKSW